MTKVIRGVAVAAGSAALLAAQGASAANQALENLFIAACTGAVGDMATEQALMEAVNALSEELTIVMIAHRLSTVEQCDRVICLAQGTVAADGPPQLVLAAQA